MTVGQRKSSFTHAGRKQISLLLVAVYAVLDEYHQAFTQYRTGSVSDSVLDMAGGLLALTLLWLSRRKPAGQDRYGAG